jgi:Concanavalin A-like lectin/glucanases superfamily
VFQGVDFSFVTKTFSGSITNIELSYIELGDGWFRLIMTLASPVENTTIDFRAYPASVTSAAPIGRSYVWGCQVEALPFASSYIPTTDSAVTRAADIVSLSGSDNIPSLNSDHTVMFSVDTIGVNNIKQPIFAAYGDDNFNRSMFFWDGDETTVLNYVSGTNFGIKVPHQTQVNHIASSYSKSGDIVGYANGIGVVSNNVPYTDAATVATTVYIGKELGSAYLYGHISDFRTYDFVLNADEISFLAGE